MADVFLSYAREDRAVAERLAHAIGEAGLSVWWDRHIKGGAEFSRDIERQLESAKRVLVLWSADAVVSRWVRDEAGVAADSGRLVSASIDGTPPPLGFRQFQTIDLQGWSARGATIPEALAEALEVEAPVPATPRRSSPPRRGWIAAGVAGALLLGAATIAIVRPAPFDRLLWGESQNEGVSLAIMPFLTPTGAGVDYLGAGLSSALADSLAPLSGLKITASTSTQALAGKKLTAPEIAKALGITHLVEGNVQKIGERYSISVRLIQAKTSEQIWTRSLEGAAEELQPLQTRMARELASALRARLGVGEGAVADRRNVDPRAYEAYLRALERVSVRDVEGSRVEAIKQFRLAASIQPDFADAHAGHAYLLALTLPEDIGMTWRELIAEQRRVNARALQLNRDNDLALIAKATALHNFHGEVDEALAIGQAVLRRSPNYAPGHYSVAASLWMRGRSREALDHVEQAIERDPFDTFTRLYRAAILYSLGDYEAVRDSIRECRQGCTGNAWLWLIAMAGFATPEQAESDFPLLAKWATAQGIPSADIAIGRGIVDGLVHGRPYALKPLEDREVRDFTQAAIAARLLNFEAGLRYARMAADRAQPDRLVDILNHGRVTFTAEQRADPRYHQLFRHPKLVHIAAARRKEGVTAGLPAFPVKAYTGR